MDHLDPRSPLVVDTRDLDRRPGSMLELTRAIPAPQDLGTDVIAIPTGKPLAVRLRLESVSEGVLVTGTAAAVASGTCARCLDPLTLEVRAPFQELFAYPDRAAHHRDTAQRQPVHTTAVEGGLPDEELDEDEVHELVGDLLDLEPVLRDALVPVLPFQPKCRADCPGLCAECGAHLADDPAHHHEVLDPRWAALHRLTSQN